MTISISLKSSAVLSFSMHMRAVPLRMEVIFEVAVFVRVIESSVTDIMTFGLLPEDLKLNNLGFYLSKSFIS